MTRIAKDDFKNNRNEKEKKCTRTVKAMFRVLLEGKFEGKHCDECLNMKATALNRNNLVDGMSKMRDTVDEIATKISF